MFFCFGSIHKSPAFLNLFLLFRHIFIPHFFNKTNNSNSYREFEARLFTKIRQMLRDNTELRLGNEELRKKTDNNTKNIEVVFQYLDELLDKKENEKPRTQIGYKVSGK